MRNRLTGLLSLILLTLLTAPLANGAVVISQVYGGGGNTGSVYTNDFIELFNAGASTVSLAGWSVQYASATGTSWQVTSLTGSIAPGQYYLVQEAQGAGGTTSLPAPDDTGTIAMSASAGKVALVSATVALSGSCPSASIVDLVGFGSTASCFEGAGPTPAPSNTNAVLRAADGCTDTDVNSADFSAGAPTPRNTASPINLCTPAAPATPTGLAAVAGTSHVALTWDSVAGATSYNVKRSTTSGSGYSTLSSPGTNSDDDATAVDGTQYFYVVSAVGPGGESADSSEVTATPMAAPINVVATPGDAHVALAWDAVAGATSYDVLRSTTSGSGYTSIATPATNSFDDTTAVNGTQYFYVIDAVNATGQSIHSSEVDATPAPPGKIVISQVYGGGGNAGSVFTNDFIELFNSGGTSVSVTGWSVQYASATGSTWQVTGLTGSIAPGQYYLVQEAQGAGGTTNLPAPDATGTISMAAGAGKVAVVTTTTASTGTCPSASIVDFVGFGTTANCFEGAGTTPAPSNTNAVFRAAGGCTDTDNNSADFTAAPAAPRNSADPLHVCGAAVNLPPTITAPADPITTVTQDAAPFGVGLTGSDDGGIFNWSATPGTGITTVVVGGGQGTANVTYTVTLQGGFTGTATFTATLTDNVNPPVNQPVNIQVDPFTPPPAPTGLSAVAGDSHVALTWDAVGGATSYNVKRGTATGGPYATIASPATNSFDDTTAVNGTTYFYVVSAVGPGGEGADSTEVSATPSFVTAVPTGLVAAVSSGSVALSWDAVGTATSYNVKRSTVIGGPYSTINSPTGTTYTDNAVTNGTRYFYVVSAVAPGSGESLDSAEVHAKPDVPEALGIDISQVYGNGGNTGSVFTNDFIEVFNRGNSTVDLSGWSVQYASAAGTSWTPTTLSGTLAPGQHYLVAEGAGLGGTTPLPSPDSTGGIAMSGTAGKVALVSSSVALSVGCPSGAGILDFVGYGATASCFEGSGPTPGASGANSQHRASDGCDDTNDNAGDFASAAATPRNTASPATPCAFTAIGFANPLAAPSGASVLLTVELPPATAGGTVTGDLTQVGGSAAQAFFDNGTNGDVTAGDNIFSFQATVSGTAGVQSIPITASNLAAQTANTSILFTITPPLETIAAVKVDTTPADTVPDRLNEAVLVRGVVTSIDFRGGTGLEYYIQDPTAGIDLFSTSDVGPALSIGTNVEVTGTLTQFNGLTEITPTSITVLPGGTLPAVSPQVVTLSQLFDGVGEPLEGKLVRIDELTVTAGTFPASGASGNVTISDSTGSGTLRVDSDTDIDGTTAPGGIFSLIGLVGQSDSTNPFDCCYQVLPRSTADIIPRTPPTGIGASNPPSVPPGASTLLTMTVTLGQNPPSTGVTVVADLSAIGLSATQTLFDDGSNGDVSPGDQIYSYLATVDSGTPLGPKSMPALIADAEGRSSTPSIPLNIQSPFAPPTPLNLVATPGNAQVGLTWDASLGASGYNVKRSTVSGGPYTTIAGDIAPTSYTDLAVNNGTTYYYVVSALSGPNESGDSTEASAVPTAPPPSGPLAKIYFVDIGQGAGTLIVGPTGTSMLIDAGPPGQGNAKVLPLLNSVLPPGDNVDYSILTHYHVDHDGGLTEVINAGRLDGGIAYDNGDGPNVVPPVPTNSTGTAFTAYKNAIASRSGAVTRTTIIPGQVIDLGGGMKATCLVAGGNLASGGNVYVSGTDLNSTSISTLIEFNDFDLLISGDMTGGGQTTTAKTPDVETFAAQMAGDVDFVELDHHGSTTASQRRFLSQIKAEGSIASIGATNTFGHPNRETANKYLNTPVTSGNTYGGEGLPNPGNGPVYYQTDPSPATDNRTSVQGYSGADQAHAGQGTILLETDGLVSFTMESFDDGGVRISPATHVYALDGQGAGITTNFPPTVIPNLVPRVPLATDAPVITALVNDREDPITSVTLEYSLNGAVQAPVMMTPSGSEYSASIPAEPDGTRVEYTVTAVAGGQSTSYAGGYFSGTTSISSLRSLTSLFEPSYLDYSARISGLVTSGTGNFSSSNNDDYIEDGTGALNLSRTIEPSSPATQPTSSGNTYTVAGFINQLTGRFRLDVTPPFDGIDKPWATTPGAFNPYSVTLTGSGTVTPLVRTIAQINADPENNEAHLVSIANCTVVSGTIPGSGGLDAFLVVSDGTGTIEMKIDAESDIPGLPTPAGSFTLLGIVQQDDFLRPFNSRYTVAPRDRTDLGAPAGGPALITIAEAREDIDPTTGISPDDFIPDRLGQQVKIRGVVTSVDFRGAAGTEVYIQDPTGGVDIFSTSINTTFNIGDDLEVVGTVSQFNGLTEIAPGSVSDITILPPGTLPAANLEVVTLSQLANGGVGEAYEGKLIRVNNVTLDSPPVTFAANTNYNFSDATGTVQMRIDGDTDIDGTAPPAGTFSVIGVLGQFDSTSPFDSGYQLFPRIRATDFLPAVPAAASITATSGTPQTTNVGTAFAQQLQATVQDAGSAAIEGIGVTFTAPAAGASGTFTNGTTSVNVATDASGVATSTVLTANGVAGPYNVVASTDTLTANFSLTNHDPSATHFDVSAPANVTQGIAFNVTVTARDSSNATATGYTGTVHFTSTSAGTLPADYTFVAGDNGEHVFSVTLTTAGPQSITATDTVTASITGTANLTVDAAAPATHFEVIAPVSVTNGVPFNVTVTALDATEATVTGYTGTVHFTSSSAGTLPADYTFVAGDSGSHTFSVTLTTNGPQSITATDTVTASITGTANTTVACPAPTPAVITADSEVCAGSTGNHASTAAGSTTYAWTITNGTITAGQGTDSITYTAGTSGDVELHVDASGPGPCDSHSGDATVPIKDLPNAHLPGDIRACSGTSVTITASLTGIPPFTVHWADGLTQSGIATHFTSRSVVAAGNVTYTIDSVTDAFCTHSGLHKTIRVIGLAAPTIDSQTDKVKILRGQTATLHVSTPLTVGVTFQWYEGNVHDTSTPVGTNAPTFTTPALRHTTSYWVRLTTSCGSVDSRKILVQVSGRSRAVGH